MKQSILYNLSVQRLLIVVLSIVAYSQTVHVPYVFDDLYHIVENPEIKDFLGLLATDKWGSRRYISYLTFALNYSIHGLDITGYHIANVFIHTINALFVYSLIYLSLRTPVLQKLAVSNHSKFIAFFSSLLFVCHPLQTQAVTYIVQRMTSLATLFYLLSIVMYIRARLAQAEQGVNKLLPVPSLFFYSISAISAVLAMKSKEIAFTLPVIIALYEFLFFEEKLKRRVVYLLPLFLTMTIIPLSVIGIDKPLGDVIGDVSEATRVQTEMSRWQYLFIQFRVVVTYIRLLFLPINQNLDYDYPLSFSFLAFPVFLSFLFLILLLSFAAYLLHQSRVRRYELRVISFGIFWFFITLSVESSVIPIQDVIFEHRMYLPSVGFFIALTSLAILFREKLRRRAFIEKTVTHVMLLILLTLSVAAYTRNSVWTDELRLWKDIVRKSPHKARSHNGLGTVYVKLGLIDEALKEYRTALIISPDYADVHNNLGAVYVKLGRVEEALNEYLTALKLRPDEADTHYNLANAYYDLGRMEEAFNEYQAALRIKPDNANAYIGMGNVYTDLGRMEEALKAYQSAVLYKPDDADAHYNLGNAYYSLNSMQEALKEYQTATKLRPDDADAHNNLGNIYFELGFMQEALWEYQTALRLEPDMASAKKNLTVLYERMKSSRSTHK